MRQVRVAFRALVLQARVLCLLVSSRSPHVRPAAPCRFLDGNYYRGEGDPKLHQGSAHFFCKGSESKQLRLGGHAASVTTAHLCVTA